MPVKRSVHIVTACLLTVGTSLAFSPGAMAAASAHTQKTLTQSRPGLSGRALSGPALSSRALSGPALSSRALSSRALSGKVNDKVIVLFKNQLSALPDTATTRTRRDAAIASIQRPVISQLRMSHAQNIRTYQVINGLAATVSPAEAARLAADPAVATVLPDEQIRLASPLPGRTPGSRSTVRSSGQTPLPGACAPKGQV